MSSIERGTDWHELFFGLDVDADDTIEVSDSQIVFTTTGGTQFTEYRNYRKIEIRQLGADASSVEHAINNLLSRRQDTQ